VGSDTTHSFELLLRRSNGCPFPAQVEIAPVRGEDWPVTQWQLAILDISDRKQAEAALHKFVSLADQSSEFIGMCDLAYMPSYVNAAGLRMVGLDNLQQALATPVAEFLFPEDRASILDAFFPKVLREGRGEIEIRFRHFKTGEPLWMLCNVFVLQDAAGRPAGLATTSRNITERKRAEAALQQSEESFRLLAELVPDVLCSCDAKGRREYISPRFEAFTGLTLQQAQGRGWMQAVHPDDLARISRSWANSRQHGEPWEERFRLRSSEGEYRWFMGRCQPLRDGDGQVVKWLGCDTDINALVRSQDALREADRRKDEFLATLAHELRNPLAPLCNALEVLRLGRNGTEVSAQFQDIMERQVRHLIRLVDDLLEVSRISLGKIELSKEAVALGSVIHHAIETSQPLIDAAGHRLTVSLLPQQVLLDADPVRLAQVFSNLLNNAAKYMEPGGTIQLTSKLANDTAVVSVRDSGIGIAAEDLPRVFELFTQIERAKDGYCGGLGIGLALVRSLVEMHGGSISAYSAGLGQGSEFVVTLPLTGLAPLAASPAPARPGALSRHRILLVDDNQDAADSLAVLLTLRGARTRVTYSGLEAMCALDTFQPTVVLMDLGMPGMDGFELAHRIRQHPRFGRVHLIALSGWGQEADRRRSQAAGIEQHLVKPVNIDDLQGLLESL
jgi:PAS domain S-box-containing protein